MSSGVKLRFSKLLAIAMVHISVGVAIVTISSFVNAEMKLANWSTSQISIFLGIPVLFELNRLIFAYLYDQYSILRPSLLVGLITSLIGILAIPAYIRPVGNILIIIMISLFYFGSSILTTLVDANLTQMSSSEERSNVAGTIQVLRLTGFAIGGIVGSILYSRISFNQLLQFVAIFYLLIGLISVGSVTNVPILTHERFGFVDSIRQLSSLISGGMPFLMMVFLILYPIGLFMQDLILEPFAIEIFNFGRENVGRVVAIWTSLTLIFVPLGVYLDNRFNRLLPILGGQFLSVIGLVGIGISSLTTVIPLFYGSLVIFGIGNGLASAPSIGMMLEVCAAHPKYLALLLGFFGIMSTIGRSLASVTGGLILYLSANNYIILFLIEAVIVIFATIPLYLLHLRMLDVEINTTSIDPMTATSIDLN